MTTRVRWPGSAVCVWVAVLVAPCCMAAAIVDVGNGSNFSYGWGPLNSTSTQWYTDAAVNNLLFERTVYSPGVRQFGYIRLASGYSGTAEWHFSADAATPFGSNVSVTYQANVFAGGYGVSGGWSTDGVSFTQFFHETTHAPLSTISLADYGFTGGEDLYLRFYLSRAGGTGGFDSVQLFRQSSYDEFNPEQTFVVQSNSPVPAPPALALLGVLLGTSAVMKRRKRG